MVQTLISFVQLTSKLHLKILIMLVPDLYLQHSCPRWAGASNQQSTKHQNHVALLRNIPIDANHCNSLISLSSFLCLRLSFYSLLSQKFIPQQQQTFNFSFFIQGIDMLGGTAQRQEVLLERFPDGEVSKNVSKNSFLPHMIQMNANNYMRFNRSELAFAGICAFHEGALPAEKPCRHLRREGARVCLVHY